MDYIVKYIECHSINSNSICLEFIAKYQDKEMVKNKYIKSNYVYKTSGARIISKEEMSICLEETIGYEARTNNIKLYVPDNILLEFLNDESQRWIWE